MIEQILDVVQRNTHKE